MLISQAGVGGQSFSRSTAGGFQKALFLKSRRVTSLRWRSVPPQTAVGSSKWASGIFTEMQILESCPRPLESMFGLVVQGSAFKQALWRLHLEKLRAVEWKQDPTFSRILAWAKLESQTPAKLSGIWGCLWKAWLKFWKQADCFFVFVLVFFSCMCSWFYWMLLLLFSLIFFYFKN